MITIQTHVYDKTSIRGRIRSFINAIIRPAQTEKMKQFDNTIKELKKKAYLGPLNVVFPNDNDHKEIPRFNNIDQLPTDIHTTHISEDWCSNRDVLTFTLDDKEYPVHDKRDKYYVYEVIYSTIYERYNCDSYIYVEGKGWLNLSDAFLVENTYSRSCEKKYTFLLDTESEIFYKRYKMYYKAITKVGHFIYDFLHTIDSIILCLRFPFLYPRNRFTGTHYNNWNVINYSKKLRDESVLNVHTRIYNSSEEHPDIHLNYYPLVTVAVSEEDEKYKSLIKKELDKEITFEYEDKTYHLYKNKTYYPIYFQGHKVIYTDKYGWMCIDKWKSHLSFDHSNEEKYQYIDNYYNKVMNYPKYIYSKIVDLFHDYILGLIFFIPTYNELDAMPDGWRRNFGIKMCKEIRLALIKDFCLFSYRITQIKEKFGGLRWYDATSTKKVQDIINKYEYKSELICIDCGKKAKYRTTGWICPYCEDCIGDDKDRAKELDDNGNVIKCREEDEEETEVSVEV